MDQDRKEDDFDLLNELEVAVTMLVTVSRPSYRSLLKELLSAPAAQWREIRSQDFESEKVQPILQRIEQELKGEDEVWMMWVDSPDDPMFCVIIFILQSYVWSKIAIYNRDGLLRGEF